jgi:hypothetical protein
LKASKNVHLCLINCGAIQSFPNTRNILSATFIKTHLLIAFEDKTKLFLRYNPASLNFQEDNCPFPHHIYHFQGYFKKLYGSEIVASILDEKTVCFVN